MPVPHSDEPKKRSRAYLGALDSALRFLDQFIKDEEKAKRQYEEFAQALREVSIMEGYSEIQSFARSAGFNVDKLKDLRKRFSTMRQTAQ